VKRVLVVGGGGREHAICWALHHEHPELDLLCLPGNPGTAEVARNLPGRPDDPAVVAAAAREHSADLTVIGPEAPLAAGAADHLRATGRRVFGPLASAARIEASKAFAKDIMEAAGVPTAESRTFTDLAKALAYVDQHPEPLVVKASGLAAGKGAIVCLTRWEAAAAVRDMLEDRLFGDAGSTIVVEDFLEGEELSVFAITNGRDVTLLPAAQDHKRLLDGDEGPNTGGMGAYAPVAFATPALLDRVRREILTPTLEELARRGAEFRGVLYAGLMISADGAPSVVEFNCRLGDPEAQTVLPLVAGGLAELFWQAAGGPGDALTPVAVRDGAAVTTVLAARGYPKKPRDNDPITIPADLGDDVLVFHAGTRRDEEGTLRTAGGRVLAVTGLGPTFAEAQQASQGAAERIEFAGRQYRRDIGWREAARTA